MKIALIIFSFLISSVYSQSIQFQRAFGSGALDTPNSCLITNDGGYIMAGSTTLGGGGFNIYLTKADSSGNLLWTKIIANINNEFAVSIEKTNDGNYIIGGYTKSFGAGDADYLLMKIDTLGNPIWSKTYGGTNIDYGYSVEQTTDGGYAIFGTTYSFGTGTDDMYLVKTNALGDTLWTKTYGDTSYYAGAFIKQTSDGGYILSGVNSGGGVVVKTDINGTLIWSKQYGGVGDASCIQQTPDGGYIIGGSTNSFGAGGMDMYILKINSIGDTLWTKTYGGVQDDDVTFVEVTSDNGFIITGSTFSFGAGGRDIVLIKTDSIGNQLWAKAYGGTNMEEGLCVKQTIDKGYIVTGITTSYGSGSYDNYLIKTDSLGNSGCNEENINNLITGNTNTVVTSVTPVSISAGIVGTPIFNLSSGGVEKNPCSSSGINELETDNISQIYPNPFSTQATITFSEEQKNSTIKILNIVGQEIKTMTFSGTELTIEKGEMQPGIYFVQIITEKKNSITKKIVVQ